MNTYERVRSIIAEHLNRSEETITPEAALENDLGADSMDIAEITMALEETFCIEFDEETLSLTTVQQIADYIESRIRARTESISSMVNETLDG